MNSVAVSLIVFACMFGGAVCGILLSRVLPQQHLSAESKDVVRVSMGLVATMVALVLGLLISSAKSFYDAQSAEVTDVSTKVVLLDRILGQYGPETTEIRDLLRSALAAGIDRAWPQDRRKASDLGAPSTSPEFLMVKIHALLPKDDTQRSLQAQASSIVIDLLRTRWLMYEQGTGSLSKPMLMILVFWLIAIFISFGLFAPRNATVITGLFLAGLSVSGAIFLIVELYEPFGGLIEISSAPLRDALTHLGQ
jgi:hypothetical protein